jgi:hypothetical protein
MGSCCGADDGHNTTKMGSRPKGKGAGAADVISYEQTPAASNEKILDAINPVVRKVYNKLGAHSIPDLNDGVTVEKRGVFNIDNNSKYDGEWLNSGG